MTIIGYSNNNLLTSFLLIFIICSCFSLAQVQYPEETNLDEEAYNLPSSLLDGKIRTALSRLKHSPRQLHNWPDPQLPLGQVTAVAIDTKNNVYVFHRGSNVWDADSFNYNNYYLKRNEPPIAEKTIVVFDSKGKVIKEWGQDMFYMPHGLTIDKNDNVWVTDVALHQVFRFSAGDHKQPNLLLGTRFSPGNDDNHYCKPSAVAVSSNGDFFVADGYCNNRIVKYRFDGTKIDEWGRPNVPNSDVQPSYSFFIPHGLALAEDINTLFVADRENGRIQSFSTDGTFLSQYNHFLIGPRLFSVAYTPKDGGLIYVINGLVDENTAVRGFVIDFKSGKLIRQFGDDLKSPHDIVVSNDGSVVYVAELNPARVIKFVEESPEHTNDTVKPTAIIGNPDAITDEREVPLGAGGVIAIGAALLVLGVAIFFAKASRFGNGNRVRRQQRWEYGGAEYKLQRLLGRSKSFSRVATDDSDDDGASLTETHNAANA